MTNNFLPWFLACLFMLGFIALVIFAYTSAFKNVRNFTSAVKEKMSSWDEFVTRTGLKWELRQPGVTNANDNPVSTKLFGSGVIDRTGRVLGTYRNYPVILENKTRSHYTMNPSLMVSNQTYFTEFLLTVKNPTSMNFTVRKDKQLTVEPRPEGAQLLTRAGVMERLSKLPRNFGLGIKTDTLVYVTDGIEQDPNQLCDILEILCDLADALKKA